MKAYTAVLNKETLESGHIKKDIVISNGITVSKHRDKGYPIVLLGGKFLPFRFNDSKLAEGLVRKSSVHKKWEKSPKDTIKFCTPLVTSKGRDVLQEGIKDTNMTVLLVCKDKEGVEIKEGDFNPIAIDKEQTALLLELEHGKKVTLSLGGFTRVIKNVGSRLTVSKPE